MKKLVETDFNIVSPAFSKNIRLKNNIRYSDNQICAHIIGYTNCDNNGVSGLEKDYNSFLRSIKNHITVNYSVDARGRMLLGKNAEIDSSTVCTKDGIKLTVDSDIQNAAQQFGASLKKGAVIVMNAKNGAVKAMASFPAFNPNKAEKYINDKDNPFLNRALNCYNIGSIFKAVVCMAALESGISPYFSYVCTGHENCGGVNFNCHEISGHGRLDMKGAVAHSCNTYFIHLAQKVGYKKIISMCKKLGIDEKIVLSDSIFAKAGNLPNTKVLSSPAGLANMSFGQGELLASPLEFCKIYSVVANGGYLVTPYLVSGKVKNGKLTDSVKKSKVKRIISYQTAKTIKSFLEYTVTDGTGKTAKMNCTRAAGKTATAQTGKYYNGREILISYFVGFFPYKGDIYTIIVMKENGLSGSGDCAPIFKNIAEFICENTKKNKG
jgi:penicillin-binding protein 2